MLDIMALYQDDLDYLCGGNPFQGSYLLTLICLQRTPIGKFSGHYDVTKNGKNHQKNIN